jgi:hypothetical protein
LYAILYYRYLIVRTRKDAKNQKKNEAQNIKYSHTISHWDSYACIRSSVEGRGTGGETSLTLTREKEEVTRRSLGCSVCGKPYRVDHGRKNERIASEESATKPRLLLRSGRLASSQL